MKNIVLCADDFGYNDKISECLIELGSHKRLSSISAMTNMPAWKKQAPSLKTLDKEISIGLHLNFTEGQALNRSSQTMMMPLAQLLKKSFCYQLNPKLIEAEIKAQIETFAEQTGYLPDYIDGHQHVHQFPIIRQALLKLYPNFYPAQQAPIRVPSNPFFMTLKTSLKTPKALIIALTGSYPLKKELIKNKIDFNHSFYGVYNLKPSTNYPDLFQYFIQMSQHNGLIMCHPGLEQRESQDEIAAARWMEYRFLQSEQFLEHTRTVHLVPFRKEN